MDEEELLRLGEAVKAACVAAALRGYQDAGMSGLCREGAWECAVDAVRMVDVRGIIESLSGIDRD